MPANSIKSFSNRHSYYSNPQYQSQVDLKRIFSLAISDLIKDLNFYYYH